MSLKDRLRLKLKVKTNMYGYNAGQPMAIPIYTVLPYCVIVAHNTTCVITLSLLGESYVG